MGETTAETTAESATDTTAAGVAGDLIKQPYNLAGGLKGLPGGSTMRR